MSEDDRIGKTAENLIAASGFAPFFEVTNADTTGTDGPENREGDALRGAPGFADYWSSANALGAPSHLEGKR